MLPCVSMLKLYFRPTFVILIHALFHVSWMNMTCLWLSHPSHLGSRTISKTMGSLSAVFVVVVVILLLWLLSEVLHSRLFVGSDLKIWARIRIWGEILFYWYKKYTLLTPDDMVMMVRNARRLLNLTFHLNNTMRTYKNVKLVSVIQLQPPYFSLNQALLHVTKIYLTLFMSHLFMFQVYLCSIWNAAFCHLQCHHSALQC